MLKLSNTVTIGEAELEFSAIRASGAGGQHVNKVSSAVHLRFDINASSLPAFYKERLLKLNDQRLSDDGCIVIKAQNARSQTRNKEDALERLGELIRAAVATQKKRRPTKPSRNAKKKRMDSKTKRGRTKSLRGRVSDD